MSHSSFTFNPNGKNRLLNDQHYQKFPNIFHQIVMEAQQSDTQIMH